MKDSYPILNMVRDHFLFETVWNLYFVLTTLKYVVYQKTSCLSFHIENATWSFIGVGATISVWDDLQVLT